MKEIFQFIFGLNLLGKSFSAGETNISSDIQLLIEERENARAKKDFLRADELRDILKEKGYEVKDKKS